MGAGLTYCIYLHSTDARFETHTTTMHKRTEFSKNDRTQMPRMTRILADFLSSLPALHTNPMQPPNSHHSAGFFHSRRGGAGFRIKRGAGINISHILTQSPAPNTNPMQPPNNQHGAGFFHSRRGGAGFSIKRGAGLTYSIYLHSPRRSIKSRCSLQRKENSR